MQQPPGTEQQGQQQQALPSMARLASDLLQDIAPLQQLLSSLQAGGPAGDIAVQALRFAQQLAVAHNKLHLWAAAGDGGVGQQQWRQELAEYQCRDYEDAMEAAYLLVQKQQYKLAGEATQRCDRHVTWKELCNHLVKSLFLQATRLSCRSRL